MNEYISKPFEPNNLFAIINNQLGGIMLDDEISEYEGGIGIDLLEMESFLDRLDGNKNLAAKLLGTFLNHFVEKQAAIKNAIDDKDPEAVKASAHAFKGMLAHFCKQATNLACYLENMGDSGTIDLEKANTAYDNLKIIIDQIAPELEEYRCRFKRQEE